MPSFIGFARQTGDREGYNRIIVSHGWPPKRDTHKGAPKLGRSEAVIFCRRSVTRTAQWTTGIWSYQVPHWAIFDVCDASRAVPVFPPEPEIPSPLVNSSIGTQAGTISRRCRSPTLGRSTVNETAFVTAKECNGRTPRRTS